VNNERFCRKKFKKGRAKVRHFVTFARPKKDVTVCLADQSMPAAAIHS